MSLRKNLEKNSGYGIGPDLPKEVSGGYVETSHSKLKSIEARKEGKRAFFSRPEPYKLFVDGPEIK